MPSRRTFVARAWPQGDGSWRGQLAPGRRDLRTVGGPLIPVLNELAALDQHDQCAEWVPIVWELDDRELKGYKEHA